VAAINVIVKLRVPDVIGSETLSCDAIADRIKVPGLDRVKLNRILRMVAGVGLLKELVGSDGKAQYRLTPGTALMQVGRRRPAAVSARCKPVPRHRTLRACGRQEPQIRVHHQENVARAASSTGRYS
jgi:hypothetical protein